VTICTQLFIDNAAPVEINAIFISFTVLVVDVIVDVESGIKFKPNLISEDLSM